MRAAILALVLLVPSLAHAGGKARAVKLAKKQGWWQPRVVAHDRFDLVAAQSHEKITFVLVSDGRRLVDLGPAGLGADDGSFTLHVSHFLGRAALWDVAVGTSQQMTHYVLRARKLELACSFEGPAETAIEVTEVGDKPLAWQVVVGDRTFGYTLGKTGSCESP